MDILIRDMDKKSLPRQVIIYPNGDVEEIAYGKYEKVAEAVAIPEHGRLVSEDEVKKNIIASVCQFCPNARANDCKGCKVEDCLQAVNNAKTIVETSKEK